MQIDVRQLLSAMETKAWFSCKLIKCNQQQCTGGEVVELKRARLLSGTEKKIRPAPGDSTASKARQKKAAEHNYHFTRNLELRTGEVIKVHPLLIFEFNGQPVI